MSEVKKCFCDLYRECLSNPDAIVNMPDGDLTGEEFIEHADRICPGTSVFIGSQALNSETVSVDETAVTFPREAVNLQCEYFVTAYLP